MVDVSAREKFIRDQIDILYNQSLHLAKAAQIKAIVYKAISVILTILIIISGTLISVLGFLRDDTFYTYISILGITVTTLKTFTSVFKFDKNSQTFKQIEIDLTSMSNKIALLNYSTDGLQAIERDLEIYQSTVNRLNVRMFGYDRPSGSGDIQSSSSNSNNSTLKGLKRYDTIYGKLAKLLREEEASKKAPRRDELEMIECQVVRVD